jgi:hypothetical protein
MNLSTDQLEDFRWHLRNALDNNILEEINFYVDQVASQLHNDNEAKRAQLINTLCDEAQLLRITFDDE